MGLVGKSAGPLTLRTDGEAQAECVTLSFQEKLRREININPYRKPTQVDEARSLRCMDEL